MMGRFLSNSPKVSPLPDAGPDSGLHSLALVAAVHHVTCEPAQLRHELGLGSRPAVYGDIVRAARELKLKARALTHQKVARLQKVPLPAIIGLVRREIRHLRPPPRRRLLSHGRRHHPRRRAPDPRAGGGAMGWYYNTDHPALQPRGDDQGRVRARLVHSGGPALQAPAAKRSGRLVVHPDLRPDHPDLLPDHHRQGPGPQRLLHPGAGPCGPRFDRLLSRHPAVPALLRALAHGEPHRRRARRPAVRSHAAAAARLFRDPCGRPDRGAGARTGDGALLPHRTRADLRPRPAVYGHPGGRAVRLLPAPGDHRLPVDPLLHHRRGGCCARSCGKRPRSASIAARSATSSWSNRSSASRPSSRSRSSRRCAPSGRSGSPAM